MVIVHATNFRTSLQEKHGLTTVVYLQPFCVVTSSGLAVNDELLTSMSFSDKKAVPLENTNGLK